MKHALTKILSFSLLSFLPLAGIADLQNGLAVSYGTGHLIHSTPNDSEGFNVAYTLQPSSWTWGSVNLGMNFSYGYWKTDTLSTHQSINTYGASPVLRWMLPSFRSITPFLQGSVGLALLSHNQFGDQNLGSTLLFQDMLGIGAAFGAQQHVYTTLQLLHYSNAGLASQNDGMTIPLMLTLGYQF